MSLATAHTRAQTGVEAPPVSVEVHLANGLPALSIVGLPEAAVREAKDRVRSALQNAGFEFPARRITVNLAPADLPKEGGRFDLPIALGILAASGQLPAENLARHECLGELSLTGRLAPVRGALPAAIRAAEAGRPLILPGANAAEAGLARQAEILPAQDLLAVCAHLRGERPLAAGPVPAAAGGTASYPDLAEVKGQHQARRALEIAAAGAHSLLYIGPPGTGKSMLAARLPGILPPMTDAEALEAAAVASVSERGFDPGRDWRRRPYRAPHHTASGVALVGGGSSPRPGEISLAHHGVLFLDELPEWDRRVLEVLREPLETGRIVISRAARQAEYPARFQLVAAMNPCPCGYLGEASGRCNCTAEQVARYRGRVSGPLLDRIDLHVEVPRLSAAELAEAHPSEASAAVAERVAAARARQLARAGKANAQLSPGEIERQAQPSREARRLLEQATERLRLSARAWHRILKVARSIADLAHSETVRAEHVSEALMLRVLDRSAPQ